MSNPFAPPHYADKMVTLHHGDALEVLARLPSHGLSGGWQSGNGAHSEGYRQMLGRMPQFQQWCQGWAVECFRVLKPGGHLLAFGGTRTYHRLTCAIEDAGFEIRDGITWGFPVHHHRARCQLSAVDHKTTRARLGDTCAAHST